ncbi:MAG: hypothetical protein WDO12_02860 [Pseudomonadota bacterium]
MSRSFLVSSAAVLMLATGLLQPHAGFAQATPTPQFSASLAGTFKEAQGARQEKRWPDVIALAQKALASTDRKADDTYYAYYLLAEAYRATGNRNEVRKAMQGMIDSGFLTPEQQIALVGTLATMDSPKTPR